MGTAPDSPVDSPGKMLLREGPHMDKLPVGKMLLREGGGYQFVRYVGEGRCSLFSILDR